MKPRLQLFYLLAFVLVALLAMPAAFGQAQLISGTVVDQTGGVIPGASVQILDEAKGTTVREVTTDDTGRFQALNIQPGTYTIKVEFTGFKTLTLNKVKLDVNTKLDVGTVKMEIGDVGTTVAVTSEIPQVQTNTMEKSYMVEQAQVVDLPMNGRNWQALVTTVPGVTNSARTNFDLTFNDVSQMHVGGGRGSQNNFYLDGSPNLDVGDNQSQYTQPSIDSVAEFKVQMSNFNAEYGRNSGMVVAVQTKSGGDKFHGTLYEFARNDAFDAVNPGRTRKTSPTDPRREKDVLRYHQFGGNIGGWIPLPGVSSKADKRLFFFYNREMTRRLGSAGSSYVDLAGPDILNGDFSSMLLDTPMEHAPQFKNGTIFVPGSIVRDGAGNIIDGTPMPGNMVPKDQCVTSSGAFLKYYGPPYLPEQPSLPDPPRACFKRFDYISPNTFRKDQDLLRLDYVINQSTTSYFRWVNDNQREQLAGAIWGWQPFPIAPQKRPKPGSSWSWNLVKAFGPTISSETILAYMHQSQELAPTDLSLIQRDTLGITFPQLAPQTNRYQYADNFDASGGGSNIFMQWGDPGWHNDGKDYSLTQNLSWVKDKHTFKFGFHYNRDNKKQTATWPVQGQINFNSSSTMDLDTGNGIANMMLGLYNNYNQASAHIYPYFRFQSWEGFAQDSFKITPRLTFEYGVRFQRTTPTYTYKRTDGVAGVDEGTFDSWSVDTTMYSRTGAPAINLDTGKFNEDPLNALLSIGLVNDLMPGVNRGFGPTQNLFAPRLGFAYDLTGDGKTAIRGGGGIFYERLRQNNFNFGAGAHYPSSATLSAGPGVVTDISLNDAGLIGPQSYVVYPADNVMPTIYSFSLGVQRELADGFALDVSYMGSLGRNLMVQRQINGLPAGYFLDNPDASANVNYWNDALRPYYGFGQLNAIETSGQSAYHGFLTRLSRRFSNGLSLNANYTWSKAFGEAENDSDQIVNPFNRHASWAPLSYSRAHVFTFDYIYQIPGLAARNGWNPIMRGILDDWQISGITEFSTGQRTSIGSNGNMYGIDLGGQNAVLVGDYKALRGQGIWFNPDAFARPMDAEWGLGRNFFTLPGTNNWDVVLQKYFPLGPEDMKLNFRLEMNNFFNHAQPWSVNTSFASDSQGGGISENNRGSFGTITAFRDPRTLQLGLKLQF